MHTEGVLEDMHVAYKHPTSMCHPLTPEPEKDMPGAVLSTREVRPGSRNTMGHNYRAPAGYGTG